MTVRRIKIFIVFFLGFMQAGCGRSQDTIYLENTMPGTELVTEAVTEQALLQEEVLQTKDCYVYVCGAVKNPGVYVLQENSRIYEAIALAGGLSETAGAEGINQAELIADGQMIRVPTQEEVLAQESGGGFSWEKTDGGQEADGRIDLNTASASELMTLPGIGQSKADAIIDYRTKNGGFSSVEDIMKIEGIKEGVYNRIKDDIKVK